MSEAQPTTYARRMAMLREVGGMLAEARDLTTALPDVLARIAAYDGWEQSAIYFAGRPAPDLVGEVLASSEPIKRRTATGRVLAFPVFGGLSPIAVVVLETSADGTVEIPERGMIESLGQMLGLCIERMRVEVELRQSEQRLRDVVHALDEGVVVVEAGKLIYWNPRAQAALGYENDTAGWMRTQNNPDAWRITLLDGTPITPDDRPSVRIARGETLRGHEVWVSRTDTAWRRALRYSGTRVIQADGTPLVVIGVSDVTERVELERLLERRVDERTEELERTNQDLDAFAAAVSHDLRAPIRAVVEFSRALQEDHALAGDAQNLAQRIERNGERLRAMVTDILALARNRRGAIETEDIDVDAMVRDIAGELRADLRVGALGHCRANRTLIRQVWTNLIDNAVKYSRTRAEPAIAIARRDDGARIAFSVADNGVGFAQENASKLFAAFQRLHPSSEFEGIGIGLANVRRIVERHGGTVSARGVVGEGSTFEFTLPR